LRQLAVSGPQKRGLENEAGSFQKRTELDHEKGLTYFSITKHIASNQKCNLAYSRNSLKCTSFMQIILFLN